LYDPCLLVVSPKEPIHSAVFCVDFVCVAVLYLLPIAIHAIVQVIAHAGAIVTLIFRSCSILEEELDRASSYSTPKSLKCSRCPFFGIIYAVAAKPLTGKIGPYAPGKLSDNVKTVGEVLFTRYLFPFEIVSVLLVAAIVGAVVLSKKKK
jgi:NADH-quinone oxidoreductase subunit J